ncbi:MAG: PASTA domain-containing protein [Ruthenibacterium lactatiformans]
MVGWTRTSASEKAKSINLSILIKYETDDSKPYNTVLSTSPVAGTVMGLRDAYRLYQPRRACRA